MQAKLLKKALELYPLLIAIAIACFLLVWLEIHVLVGKVVLFFTIETPTFIGMPPAAFAVMFFLLVLLLITILTPVFIYKKIKTHNPSKGLFDISAILLGVVCSVFFIFMLYMIFSTPNF